MGFVRVPPMLATIGTMLLYSGIGMAITGGRGVVGFPDAFMVFGNARFVGIPVPLLLMILVFIVIGLALERTVWGRSVYLVGEQLCGGAFFRESAPRKPLSSPI